MVRTYFAEDAVSSTNTVEKRLLQISLFLPFVVPILAGLIFNLLSGSGTYLSDSFGGVLGFSLVISIYAIIFGSIPYVVLLVGALAWSRHKSDVQVHRMIWLLPVLFVPLFWLFWTFVSALLQTGGIATNSPLGIENSSVLGFGLIALLVSYAYVLPVSIIYLLVKTARAG